MLDAVMAAAAAIGLAQGLKHTSALPVQFTEGAPTRSLAHKASRQRLFSGFTVALLPAATAPAAEGMALAGQSHSIETMSSLLQLGGATVLRQEQQSIWLQQQRLQAQALAAAGGGNKAVGEHQGGARRLVIVCSNAHCLGAELTGTTLQQEWGTADVLIHTYITDCVLTYQLLPTLQYRL
jgi:hypothetical protein